MKDLDKLKDYEFSELLSNVSFVEKKENVDEDGDLLKEELLNVDTKKSNHNFLAIATNFAFTIFSPVILLVGIYLIIIKFLQIKKNDIFIVFLMLLGVLSGYWSLYKDIKKISKKGLKNEIKDKEIK